jgi:hypothetical protein
VCALFDYVLSIVAIRIRGYRRVGFSASGVGRHVVHSAVLRLGLLLRMLLILLLLWRIVRVAPEVGPHPGVVRRRVVHVRFSLVEAYVMLHLENGDIGGSREVDGFGRGWRQDAELVAKLWFLRRLRTHVFRYGLRMSATTTFWA